MQHPLGWAYALMALLALILALCAWVVWRDARLRGQRIDRKKWVRERVTISLPSFAMRDFKNRTYK